MRSPIMDASCASALPLTNPIKITSARVSLVGPRRRHGGHVTSHSSHPSPGPARYYYTHTHTLQHHRGAHASTRTATADCSPSKFVYTHAPSLSSSSPFDTRVKKMLRFSTFQPHRMCAYVALVVGA